MTMVGRLGLGSLPDRPVGLAFIVERYPHLGEWRWRHAYTRPHTKHVATDVRTYAARFEPKHPRVFAITCACTSLKHPRRLVGIAISVYVRLPRQWHRELKSAMMRQSAPYFRGSSSRGFTLDIKEEGVGRRPRPHCRHPPEQWGCFVLRHRRPFQWGCSALRHRLPF